MFSGEQGGRRIQAEVDSFGLSPAVTVPPDPEIGCHYAFGGGEAVDASVGRDAETGGTTGAGGETGGGGANTIGARGAAVRSKPRRGVTGRGGAP